MKTMTPYDAIGEALAEEMRRDATVLAFGEGIATKRHDLVAEFGAARIRNTPLAEGSSPAPPPAPRRRAFARSSTSSSPRS